MPLSDAKDLHTDITKLLIAVHELQLRAPQKEKDESSDAVDGGEW